MTRRIRLAALLLVCNLAACQDPVGEPEDEQSVGDELEGDPEDPGEEIDEALDEAEDEAE